MRRFLVAALAAVAFVVPLSGAVAIDNAYWRGKIGPFWRDEPDRQNRIANWYAAANGGRMAKPPEINALFPRGVAQRDITIEAGVVGATEPETEIGGLVFLPGGPRYEFLIEPNAIFLLRGQGVVVQSRRAPKFLIRGAMGLTGSAAVVSNTGQPGAEFTVERGGALGFFAFARGGEAKFKTVGGRAQFRGRSSAEDMTFELSSLGINYSAIVQFFDRSTPGRAQFKIFADATVNFGSTTGPNNDRSITSGPILSYGNLFTGLNMVTVVGDYENPGPGGSLTVDARGARIGSLFVRGKATIAGPLYVTTRSNARPVPKGSYRILHARDGVSGRFASLGPSFPNWELEYEANEVVLRVR